MSEDNHTMLAVLRAQYLETCRRLEEIRADVREEQAGTRVEMKDGFVRMEARYSELEERLRTVEQVQGQDRERVKEQLSTWRAVVPLLAGVTAGLGSFAKDLIQLLK